MKALVKDLDRYLLIFNALRKKGLSMQDIAISLNITNGAVTHFMYGYNKSKRFDAWVKKNLGIKL